MGTSGEPVSGGSDTSCRVKKGTWSGVTCSADGCDRPVSCKGLCSTHYHKARWASGHRPPSLTPENERKARLRYRYGIEIAEYDAMLEAQGGLCAICRLPPDGTSRGGRLFVDHCHETGKIRGLLCNKCNLAVGYLGSESALLRAAEYVRNRS